MQYAPNVRVVRLMCSGRLDPQFVLAAFRHGADGVLIGGCHPGDCHYQEGNYNARRRIELLRGVLRDMGVEDERLRLEWISASEGEKVQRVCNEMTEQVRRLGPLRLSARRGRPCARCRGGAMTKPKVAFYWCASCGGCEEAVVDLAEDLLAVVEPVDIVFWPVALDFKRADVEALADGELAAAFLNGAVRTSEQEEMVELLRRKSAAVVAFGSCAGSGGIPGLANLYEREAILDAVYREAPSVANDAGTLPAQESRRPGGHAHPAGVLRLGPHARPGHRRRLLPARLPAAGRTSSWRRRRRWSKGTLPAKGTVLAPDVALCSECPRAATKPDKLLVQAFRRPARDAHRPGPVPARPGPRLPRPRHPGRLRRGLPRREHALHRLHGPDEPRGRPRARRRCRPSRRFSTSNGEDEIVDRTAEIADPVGTFYRYGLPASLLHRRVQPPAREQVAP